METVEEILIRLVNTMSLQDDARRLAREDLCRDVLPFYLAAIAEMTGESFAVGDSLTVADLKLAQFIQMLRSGTLDHVPTDLVSRTSPKLRALDEFISIHPQVVAHSA